MSSGAPFSYDPEELKQSLIEYFQTKEGFEDFNYEGSALNTTIDLLVRNTHYIGYMANMLATESFLDSAQLRANVVSHAQKLSYVPRSKTATTIIADIEVIPADIPSVNETAIVATKGTPFINTIGNTQYQFVLMDDVVLVRYGNNFVANDVELKQGQLIKQQFSYDSSQQKLEIINKDVDTSTIRVSVRESQSATLSVEYNRVEDITNISEDDRVFYLSENTRGFYDVEFGKGILGYEPVNQSIVEIEYIVVEDSHANQIKEIYAAGTIGGYSNVNTTVTVEGFGGADKPGIDHIKFIAPKVYETQNRAVRERDYASLIMRDYPFIKSANVWGGEKNIPPYYGRVFISALNQDGGTIANTVKDRISQEMQKYSMTAVELVDPRFLRLELTIDAMIDESINALPFSNTQSRIQDIVDEYSSEILEFGQWYNNSLLIQRIKDSIRVVMSVEIDVIIKSSTQILPSTNSKYVIEFLNSIVPGTLITNDLVLDSGATEQSIFDDSNGNVIKRVVRSGVALDEVIGFIDYKTGYVEFTTLILNEGDLTLSCIPVTDNVYSDRDYIISVDSSNIRRSFKGIANGNINGNN